ncbi:MAG: diacylglycerol kinase, partial [Hydrogenophaga sp.]|nr:diacylglycerol kinase [Hydrogenophaga sp.]
MAVVLKPMGSFAMLGLLLRGAMGTLGEADSIESFEFEQMVVKPPRMLGRRRIKMAFDGEVVHMQPPLAFSVMAKPLYLLKPPPEEREAPA